MKFENFQYLGINKKLLKFKKVTNKISLKK